MPACDSSHQPAAPADWVFGQVNDPDRSTNPSECPVTRERCHLICQFLKSFCRGALPVCGQMLWLAVGCVERIAFTHGKKRSTKGIYQAIEGVRMRGVPTPCKAYPDLRKRCWMLHSSQLSRLQLRSRQRYCTSFVARRKLRRRRRCRHYRFHSFGRQFFPGGYGAAAIPKPFSVVLLLLDLSCGTFRHYAYRGDGTPDRQTLNRYPTPSPLPTLV